MGTLTNFSGTTLNSGTYNVSGTLQFNGANIVTNAASITLNGAGSSIVNQSSTNALLNFANNAVTGKFTLSENQNLTTTGGSFTNSGIFNVLSGSTFTVGGSSYSFTQTAGTTTVDGTLTASSAGTLALNGGSLFGRGTLGYGVVDASTITPGDSSTATGDLSVTKAYTQNSAGALDVSIGGTTAGAQYDQLKVTGAATLGGTLNVKLLNNFTPAINSTFDILHAGSVADQFSTENGLAINGSEHFAVSFTGTDVILTVVSGAASASSAHSAVALHQLSPGVVASGLDVPGVARSSSASFRAAALPQLSPSVIGSGSAMPGMFTAESLVRPTPLVQQFGTLRQGIGSVSSLPGIGFLQHRGCRLPLEATTPTRGCYGPPRRFPRAFFRIQVRLTTNASRLVWICSDF